MQETKKLNAFTVSELLVVLVVSSLVITLALLVLNLTQKQIYAIQKNTEKSTEIRILERTLWQDMNRFSTIDYDEKKEVLVLKHPLDSVRYTFDREYILRNKDTFKIKIETKEFYLQTDKVKQGTVDAISLFLSKEYKPKELFIFTQKSAQFQMNTSIP